MKKLLLIMIVAAAMLSVSCSDRKYEIIVNDKANVMTNAEEKRLKTFDTPAGYQIIVETVNSVEDGKVFKYVRERSKHYKKISKCKKKILVVFIKKSKMIITDMPESLENLISAEYASRYYKLQKASSYDDIASMTGFLIRRVSDAIHIPWWKSNAISESVQSFTDLLFLTLVPSKSFLYTITMSIPLKCSLFLLSIFKSFTWSILFIFVLNVMARRYINKNKLDRGLYKWLYKLFNLFSMLVIFSFYIVITPRMEYVYSLRLCEFNPNLINALDRYYSDFKIDTESLFVMILFCVTLVVNKIVSNPEFLIISLCNKAYQRKYYQQNKTRIKILKSTIDSFNRSNPYNQPLEMKLDESEAPFSDLMGEINVHAMYSLLLWIPASIILNGTTLLIVICMTGITVMNNINEVKKRYKTCAEEGVLKG